jgi:hypothetical protein
MTKETMFQFRIEVALKRHAEKIAARRDEKLSQVLRRALRLYVATGGESNNWIEKGKN